MYNQIVKSGKILFLAALFSFAAVSLQGCYDQKKEVKIDRALKSNCQMKSDAKKKCQAGKCQSGKCGTGKK